MLVAGVAVACKSMLDQGNGLSMREACDQKRQPGEASASFFVSDYYRDCRMRRRRSAVIEGDPGNCRGAR